MVSTTTPTAHMASEAPRAIARRVSSGVSLSVMSSITALIMTLRCAYSVLERKRVKPALSSAFVPPERRSPSAR